MILKDIAVIAAENNRTKAYLQNMIKHNLIPSFAVVMITNKKRPETRNKKVKVKMNNMPNIFDGKFSFQPELSIKDTLIENGIPHIFVETDTINDIKINITHIIGTTLFIYFIISLGVENVIKESIANININNIILLKLKFSFIIKSIVFVCIIKKKKVYAIISIIK